MYKKTYLMLLITIFISLNLFAQKSLERIGNEAEVSGDEFFNNKEYDKAVQKYDEATQKFREAKAKDNNIIVDEKIIAIEDKIFKAYYFGGSYAEAVAVLKNTLKRTNDIQTAKLIAQILHKNIGNIDAAISFLQEYNSHKRNFIIEKKIASYYLQKESLPDALKWFQNAYELKQDKEVIKNIATLHLKLGDNDNAIKAYHDFIKTNPSKSILKKTYKNMAVLYENMNKITKAIETYEKCLTYSYDKNVTLKLIDLYYENKNYENALKKIAEMLKIDQNNKDAIFYRAMIHYNREEKQAAKADFKILAQTARYKKTALQFIDSIDSE